jgi:hypothetical protein
MDDETIASVLLPAHAGQSPWRHSGTRSLDRGASAVVPVAESATELIIKVGDDQVRIV